MKRLILSALLLVSASGWAQQDISRAFEHGVVTTERPQQRDIYIYTYDDLYPPPPPPRSYFYSGLNLNQYGVASPCRTICTVCGFVALS